MVSAMSGPESHISAALLTLGILDIEDNPDLQDTPARWIRAMREMTAGYQVVPGDLLSKTFDPGYQCDELVILKDIDFTSLCEHHLLPFTGVAHLGYLPNQRVVGLSKLARLVDCFALRLQVQERMTHQISSAMTEHLQSKAVGVVIEAKHSCMGCRGVRKPGAVMVTSSMTGTLRENAALRAEFMALIR